MLGMLELLLHWLTSQLKSRLRLQAENLVLCHQVNILRRRASRPLQLSNADRLAFVWLYRCGAQSLGPADHATCRYRPRMTTQRLSTNRQRSMFTSKSVRHGVRHAIPSSEASLQSRMLVTASEMLPSP
jgi:hypothetical protein